MERYFKRKYTSDVQSPIQDYNGRDQVECRSKLIRLDDLLNLQTDPGLRTRISDYHPDDQDRIRREYLELGPCQPRDYKFPQNKIGNRVRCFNPSWFTEFASWLEYSMAKDAAFCFHCYLFGSSTGEQGGGDDFVAQGFTNWEMNERFRTHVGETNSLHNQAYMKTRDFIKQQNDVAFFPRQLGQTQSDYEYQVRLSASVVSMRYLLCQGLVFHGNDESNDIMQFRRQQRLLWQGYDESESPIKYPEILFDHLQFVAKICEGIKKVILQNAPENLRLITPDIQRDIVNAAATETLNVIRQDLGNSLYAVLIGESSDASMEVKLVVFIRYVDRKGYVIERFMGIMDRPESETTVLKATLETLFCKFGLSKLNWRGLGYCSGDTDMRREFSGFNPLILLEKKSAFYVHCFAHNLHVELIHVGLNHFEIYELLESVSKMVKVIGASTRYLEIDRKKQALEIVDNLKSELSGSQRFNQETDLEEYNDRHWAPDYTTLMGLIGMFSSVIDMLEFILKFGRNRHDRGEACGLLDKMLCFDFVFSLHLMRNILGITNSLAQMLLQKDQDFVNLVNLINISKQQLQMMRENGWDELFTEVSSFCVNHDLMVPDMDENHVQGLPCRPSAEEVKSIHYYQVELFHSCIDRVLEELNSWFDEVNMEVLLCMSCLNPTDSFAAFDKQKLIRLAQFYPVDFSGTDLVALPGQLDSYITDMYSNVEFSKVDGINSLVQKMVETKKDIEYPLVFLLMTLSLTLPIASANVKRTFSTMRTLKNILPDHMGDEWMNSCLVTFIERDIYGDIEREVIMRQMEKMRMSRGLEKFPFLV